MKHILLTTIAAVLVVGCGEAQQSAPQAEPVEPIAEVAKPEQPTAKAPDISIHAAAEDGNIEAVKQHIAAGTDVNARDSIGETTLHFAARWGHKGIAELLIANGADVNAKHDYGYTPLHWTANNGHKEVVELLIAKGADVNAKDNQGRTPLDVAIEFKHTETADLLRQYGGKTKQEIDKWPNAVGYLFYGRDQLSIYGEIGLKFDVRYSSDLKEWKVLDTVTLESSRQIYLDQSAAEQPMRFYQLRLVE